MASKNVTRSTPGPQPKRPRLHPLPGVDSDQLRAYCVLYRLNRAFEVVRLNLDCLQELGFRRLFLEEFYALAEELRAETNFKLTAELGRREQEDWRRFGLLTREREKRLRDPNDILLEAGRMRRKQQQQKGNLMATESELAQKKQRPSISTRKPKRA
jgi:hypothetical protein